MLVKVELLGVNRNTDNNMQANFLATSGRILPWLQDTQTNVWKQWSVQYRDLIILDSSNRVTRVINLTFNDLAVETNRTRLKEMLRGAANGADSDGDLLPDHWEYRYLGDLAANREMDSDSDGFNNFMELTFGTNPLLVSDIPKLQTRFNGLKQFTVTFDRWAGNPGTFLVESSTNLVEWTNSAQIIRSTTAGLYDGTGRARATYILNRSSTFQPSGFVRVNARPRQ